MTQDNLRDVELEILNKRRKTDREIRGVKKTKQPFFLLCIHVGYENIFEKITVNF